MKCESKLIASNTHEAFSDFKTVHEGRITFGVTVDFDDAKLTPRFSHRLSIPEFIANGFDYLLPKLMECYYAEGQAVDWMAEIRKFNEETKGGKTA